MQGWQAQREGAAKIEGMGKEGIVWEEIVEDLAGSRKRRDRKKKREREREGGRKDSVAVWSNIRKVFAHASITASGY